MNLSLSRNLFLPIALTAVLAGGTACNRNNNVSAELTDEGVTQAAIIAVRTGTKIEADQCLLMPLITNEALENEKLNADNNIAVEWANFNQKPDKTRFDSLAMYGFINDYQSTIEAIDYLKAQRAIYDANQMDIMARVQAQQKEMDSIANAKIVDFSNEMNLTK